MHYTLFSWLETSSLAALIMKKRETFWTVISNKIQSIVQCQRKVAIHGDCPASV